MQPTAAGADIRPAAVADIPLAAAVDIPPAAPALLAAPPVWPRGYEYVAGSESGALRFNAHMRRRISTCSRKSSFCSGML
jgi:hypothetical protein